MKIKYYHKNNMKPNIQQYNILVETFNNLKNKFNYPNDAKVIFVKKEFYTYFFEREPIPIKLDFKSQNLQDLLNNKDNGSLFSIRKLTSE